MKKTTKEQFRVLNALGLEPNPYLSEYQYNELVDIYISNINKSEKLAKKAFSNFQNRKLKKLGGLSRKEFTKLSKDKVLVKSVKSEISDYKQKVKSITKNIDFEGVILSKKDLVASKKNFSKKIEITRKIESKRSEFVSSFDNYSLTELYQTGELVNICRDFFESTNSKFIKIKGKTQSFIITINEFLNKNNLEIQEYIVEKMYDAESSFLNKEYNKILYGKDNYEKKLRKLHANRSLLHVIQWIYAKYKNNNDVSKSKDFVNNVFGDDIKKLLKLKEELKKSGILKDGLKRKYLKNKVTDEIEIKEVFNDASKISDTYETQNVFTFVSNPELFTLEMNFQNENRLTYESNKSSQNI